MKVPDSEKGFSMVELIIVVAIMGIIGAVLVPYYFNSSDRARVTTDVSSLITVQNQIEVYKAEFSKEPGTDAEGIIKELSRVEYFNEPDMKVDGKIKLQTPGAKVVYDITVQELRLEVSKHYYDLCKNNQNTLKWLKQAP